MEENEAAATPQKTPILSEELQAHKEYLIRGAQTRWSGTTTQGGLGIEAINGYDARATAYVYPHTRSINTGKRQHVTSAPTSSDLYFPRLRGLLYTRASTY